MIDPIARLLGAAGLAVGVSGLILTAYLWYRSGPRLKVVAKVPAGMAVVQIEVMNVGRMAASVREIELRDHFVLMSATGSSSTKPTSRWAIRAVPTGQDVEPIKIGSYNLAANAFLRANVDITAILAKADGAPEVSVTAWVQRGDDKWFASDPLKLR